MTSREIRKLRKNYMVLENSLRFLGLEVANKYGPDHETVAVIDGLISRVGEAAGALANMSVSSEGEYRGQAINR